MGKRVSAKVTESQAIAVRRNLGHQARIPHEGRRVPCIIRRLRRLPEDEVHGDQTHEMVVEIGEEDTNGDFWLDGEKLLAFKPLLPPDVQ